MTTPTSTRVRGCATFLNVVQWNPPQSFHPNAGFIVCYHHGHLSFSQRGPRAERLFERGNDAHHTSSGLYQTRSVLFHGVDGRVGAYNAHEAQLHRGRRAEASTKVALQQLVSIATPNRRRGTTGRNESWKLGSVGAVDGIAGYRHGRRV